MNRIIVALLLSVIMPVFGLGQTLPPNYPNGELHEFWKSNTAKFDSIIENGFADSLFFSEGGEYQRFNKWFDFWEPRLAGHGDFSVYYNARDSFYLNSPLVQTRSTNIDDWIEIGPYEVSNTCGIGPTFFLEISETNPDYILCGAGQGGLFYTTNASAIGAGSIQWLNTGTDTEWKRSACAHATFYPSNENIWFAVTLDDQGPLYGPKQTLRGNPKASFVGPIRKIGGLYRKLSLSGAWDQFEDYTTFNNKTNTAIKKLVFDPKLNVQGEHTLFLATNHGLWKTEDPLSSIPTWTQIIINAPATITNNPTYAGYEFHYDSVTVYDIEYQPQNLGPSSTMFLTAQFYGTDGINEAFEWRVMQSDDNGVTWFEIPGQPAGFEPDLRYMTIETSRTDISKIWVLVQILHPALSQNEYSSGVDGHIKEYSLSTGIWNNLNVPGGVNEEFGKGYSFAIDQDLERYIVYAGKGSTLGCAGWGSPLRIFDMNTSTNVASLATTHPDIRDVMFHPSNPGEVWICNDGGINRSFDYGFTWEDQSEGLGIAQVNSLAISYNTPDHILLGLYHDGSVVTRNTPYDAFNWNPTWEFVKGGDGTRSLIQSDNPDKMYVSNPASGGNASWRGLTNGTISNSGIGQTKPSQWWAEGEVSEVFENTAFFAGFVNPVTHIWTSGGTANEIVRSPDNMFTLEEAISDFSSVLAPESVLHVGLLKANPYFPDHLYVAVRTTNWRYRLFRTKICNDDPSVVRNSWEELPTPKLVFSAYVTGIDFDPNNEDIVYIAFSANNDEFSFCPSPNQDIMVTKMDYSDLSVYDPVPLCGFDCATGCGGGPCPCYDFTMNLPNTFTARHCLVYEKGSNGGLYLATDFGVYYTNNERIENYNPLMPEDPDLQANTTGWVRLGNGLPGVVPNGMEVNYEINRLRVGFFGRGVWEHDLQCPNDFDLLETGVYSNNYFFEVENDITSIAEVPTGTDITYRAGNRITLQPGFKANANSDFHAYIHACNHPGNSFRAVLIDEEREFEDSDITSYSPAFNVLPNPSEGLFTITCTVPPNTNYELCVFNSSGQQVMYQISNSETTQIDLTYEQTGIYLVLLTYENQTWTSKIIKQ